jgi:hypothetical protein
MLLSIPELLAATQLVGLFTRLCNTTREQGIVVVTIIFTIYMVKMAIMYHGGNEDEEAR